MSKETQLNVAVDPELLRKFKIRVIENNVTIRQRLTELIEGYLEGTFELDDDDLPSPKPSKRRTKKRGN